MSLAPEKYNSIFRMREVLYGILWSKKCKIPDIWRNEIRYAVKHCPSSYDIQIKGQRFTLPEYDIQKFIKWVEWLDENSAKKKKRKK